MSTLINKAGTLSLGILFACVLAFAISLPLYQQAHAQEGLTDFAFEGETSNGEDDIVIATSDDDMSTSDVAENTPIASENKDPKISAEKFQLAEEIIALNPIETTLTTTIDNLAEKIPAERRILFKSIMNRSIKIDRLNSAAQLAFIEIFTLEELKGMRDFYASDVGKSVNQKMPLFEKQIEPVIQTMVEDAVYNIKNSNVDFSQ